MGSALRMAGPGTRRLMEVLMRDVVRQGERRGDAVAVRVNSGWVAFASQRKRRVFAEVRPRKKHIEVFILPPRRHLNDPRGLVQTMPPSRGWGWFHSRFWIRDADEMNAATRLMLQSMAFAPNGNGGRQHPRLRRSANARTRSQSTIG